MITDQEHLVRQGPHRPLHLRLLALVVGAALIFVGYIGWTVQEVQGAEGAEYVVVEDGAIQVDGTSGAVVAGTQVEDGDWLDQWRNTRNVTLPVILFIGGGLALLAGLAPSSMDRSVIEFDRPEA